MPGHAIRRQIVAGFLVPRGVRAGTNAGRRRQWLAPNCLHPKSDGPHFGLREKWRRSGRHRCGSPHRTAPFQRFPSCRLDRVGSGPATPSGRGRGPRGRSHGLSWPVRSAGKTEQRPFCSSAAAPLLPARPGGCSGPRPTCPGLRRAVVRCSSVAWTASAARRCGGPSARRLPALPGPSPVPPEPLSAPLQLDCVVA